MQNVFNVCIFEDNLIEKLFLEDLGWIQVFLKIF